MNPYRTPAGEARRAARQARQERAWVAKAGPVVVSVTDPATGVRSWPARIATRCYWCSARIEIGQPLARLSVSARDGWYGCPECVTAARKDRPP